MVNLWRRCNFLHSSLCGLYFDILDHCLSTLPSSPSSPQSCWVKAINFSNNLAKKQPYTWTLVGCFTVLWYIFLSKLFLKNIFKLTSKYYFGSIPLKQPQYLFVRVFGYVPVDIPLEHMVKILKFLVLLNPFHYKAFRCINIFHKEFANHFRTGWMVYTNYF